MIANIERGTTILKTGAVSANEDVELHLPNSIRRLEAFCISGILINKLGNKLTVYYDGTIDQWKAIIKGKCEYEVREDWYGYYYHNSDRYETVLVYTPFFHTDIYLEPTIICKDGEITSSKYEGQEACLKYMKEHKEI